MKRYIFPFLMFVLLLGVNKTDAQQAKVTTGTFKAVAAKHGPAITLVSVKYTMTLSPAKDKLTIVTHSDEPASFNLDVLGSDSKVVSHWKQSATADGSHDFDISSLASGNYQLNITHTNSKVLHSVSFTK